MKRLIGQILIMLTGCFLIMPASAAKLTAERRGSKINVSIDGKFFTSYVFSEDEKYPFFYPVNGPLTGGSVTSMRNAVYPHHTSLFFGCDMVNGGNYWQEGLERGRIISVNARIEKEGGDTVLITDECIWSRPGAVSPVKDTRKYIITAPSAGKTFIDVEITMHTLMDVRIKKTNHSLFSARLAADISVTNGGTMINAEGDMNEKDTFGKRSPWIDFSGSRGNNVEGLAILQHPSNPWFPAPWFTRDYGFISPTPMYWPENGEETFLKDGSKLVLKYRVIVHYGDHKQADIAGEYKKYISGTL
ncbi:MAG TPA: PmoA family protein [Bacteroidales bacterium]|nr:PmoA family protein [Bacteroidales bacterium]